MVLSFIFLAPVDMSGGGRKGGGSSSNRQQTFEKTNIRHRPGVVGPNGRSEPGESTLFADQQVRFFFCLMYLIRLKYLYVSLCMII